MLDDRIRSVLERLEREDADERDAGLPIAQRSRAVEPTSGRFLFALVAPQTDCEVLEIGGSRGYSTIWLAAGVRYLGGRVLSLEHDPRKIEAWRRNIADAGLEDWAELVEGDARETIPTLEGPFGLVFVDGTKVEYREYLELAEPKLAERAMLVVDNLLMSGEVGLPEGADTFWSPENLASARALNTELVNSDDWVACVLPVGDGIVVAARR